MAGVLALVGASGCLLPFGRWVHVRADFNPAGTLHYDIGTTPFTQSFPGFTPTGSTSIVLELGAIAFDTPVPAIDIRWDNVVLDAP